MKKSRKYRIGFVAVVLTLASVGIAAQQTDIYFLIKKNFSIFSKTYENVALEYVDEVDPEILMRNGMKAMLETLDPYTVLFDESQNEQAEIFSRGNYAGIGIDAGYRDGKIVVIAPVEGGPADKAGIRAGDVIIAVDDISTEDLQPEEVSTLTAGEAGSEVNISIERFGLNQTLDFTLERERIEVTNVSYSGLIGNNQKTGYIRLAQFGNKSADEIRTAMMELSEKTDLQGLVLDLRDNPGGILQEAVGIIDKFIEPGITVVETRGRIADYNQSFVSREPVMFDKPLVVLMNGGSASASEVVAGTLQDLDRALIIGEQSFGKGLVQIVKPLPYNTSLKITISRYYIPSGRSIQSIKYTHKGKNSGMINSDSTQNEFQTRNGRIVYEGRGIEPDIDSKAGEMSLLETALMQQGMYFNFATEFEAQNESFEADELDDSVFRDFRNYLEKHNFSYKTDAERTLENLEDQLAGAEGSAQQLSDLNEIIDTEKENQFKNNESSIRKALFLELTSRYKGQSGRIEAGLEMDPEVLEALDFITEKEKMAKLLSGQ
ncbi:MAG: S41 family peptidase [Balneolaceae bacterium]